MKKFKIFIGDNDGYCGAGGLAGRNVYSEWWSSIREDSLNAYRATCSSSIISVCSCGYKSGQSVRDSLFRSQLLLVIV